MALILTLVGLVGVSHSVIFIRLAEDAPALLLAAARVLLATVVFAPFAWHAVRRIGRPDLMLVGLSLLSGFFLAIHFASWIASLQRLTIAESVLLVSLSPIWIALLEAVLARANGKRRWPARGVLIGIGLCLIGLAVIGGDGLVNPDGDLIGLGLAGLGGVVMAGYLVIGKRVRAELPTSLYVVLCYGGASAFLVLAGVLMEIQVTGFGLSVWMAILELGLVSQVIGHSAYNAALGRLSPILVAICLLGEPIFGSLLGLLYLGEAIPPATLMGAIPILTGLWLAIRAEMSAA